MKTTTLPLSIRLRLAVLRGLARLFARAAMPTLRPIPVHAARTVGKPRSGDVIDGEFRRIDSGPETRHNDRW